MTAKLKELQRLEQSIAIQAAMSIKYGRPRFVVEHRDGSRSGKFASDDFAQMLFDSLTDAKVFFVHEDGTEEDFTEYFTTHK